MGKVYSNKVCSLCGTTGKCIEIFGVMFCKPCYNKKPHRHGGNSGMVYNDKILWEDFVDLNLHRGLVLKQVKKSNPLFVKWYIEHYPGSKGIMGRQINYLIYYNQEPIGIIGANSPPLNYKLFIKYFNFNNYIKGESEKVFVNNNVFRVVRKPEDKNIGTKILKLFRKTICVDYTKHYGDYLIGIITFVEPPRTGSIYKADNWDYLGVTQGISVKRLGLHSDWVNKEYTKGSKKHIFAKRF